MAFGRKALKAMGLTDEQVDSLIEMHDESIAGLKAYKADAEKLIEVQKQLDEANRKLESAGKDDYKDKYEALLQETKNKEIRTSKEAALKGLLDELGISEKGKALALKYTDMNGVELDEAGKLTNGAAVRDAVLADWGDYKEHVTEKGANVVTPPAGSGGNTTMTREQIMAIPDRTERRAAIAQNMALFDNKTEN